MDTFSPIAGIALEQYADLCARMADTNNDEAREVAVAEAQGVSGASWLEAKRGWTERMMEDARTTGKLAQAFMPLYQAAQGALRGGAEPMDLAGYAKLAAELAFTKGPDGRQVDQAAHLATRGLTITKWGEISGYWVPKVNDPANPDLHAQFAAMMQAESDIVLGIQRAPALLDGADAETEQAPPPPPEPEVAAQPEPEPEPEPGPSQGIVESMVNAIKSFFG